MTAKVCTLAIVSFASAGFAAAALAPASALAAPISVVAKAVQDTPNLNMSPDGFAVLRDIRAARVAIFKGDNSHAADLVEKAKADLARAGKDTDAQFERTGPKGLQTWLVIDGQLLVSDGIAASPASARQVTQSNVALQEGDASAAVSALKKAQINVGFTRVLMPLQETVRDIDTALAEIGAEKFYQANQVLKSAEDALDVDTIMIDEAAPGSGASPQTPGSTATSSQS